MAFPCSKPRDASSDLEIVRLNIKLNTRHSWNSGDFEKCHWKHLCVMFMAAKETIEIWWESPPKPHGWVTWPSNLIESTEFIKSDFLELAQENITAHCQVMRHLFHPPRRRACVARRRPWPPAAVGTPGLREARRDRPADGARSNLRLAMGWAVKARKTQLASNVWNKWLAGWTAWQMVDSPKFPVVNHSWRWWLKDMVSWATQITHFGFCQETRLRPNELTLLSILLENVPK